MSITLNIAEDGRKPRQVEKGYEGQVIGVGVASTGDANLSAEHTCFPRVCHACTFDVHYSTFQRELATDYCSNMTRSSRLVTRDTCKPVEFTVHESVVTRDTSSLS